MELGREVETFRATPIAGKAALISYFTSFEEAKNFYNERGEKFFDFSEVQVCISGKRYLAAVEYVE